MSAPGGDARAARPRDDLTAAVAARLADDGARVDDRGDIIVPLGAPSAVVIRIGPAGAPRALARFDTCSVRYAIRGPITDHGARARAIVERALAAIEATERVQPATLASLEDALASDDELAPIQLARSLARELDALLPLVTREYPRRVAARWRRPSRPVEGLPHCLALELRPTRGALGDTMLERADAVSPPCDDCGSARTCPGARRGEHARSSPALRVLAHADDDAALWAALDATSATFGARVPEAVHRFVVATRDARRSDPASHSPLELSLKLEGDRIVPTIRIVDYESTPRGRTLATHARAERRAHVLDRVADLVGGDARAAADEWLARLEGHLRHTPELSVGLDTPVASASAGSAQVYAHLLPDAERVVELVADLLRWSSVREDDARVAARLVTAPQPTGERRAPTLIACSLRRDGSREQKLYVASSLTDDGLFGRSTPSTLGALEPFAPDDGLFVFETAAGALRARKRDFPCAAHFQRSGALVDALARPLCSEHASALHRLLDGSAFAAWPTWLSVGRATTTFYFVPR